MSRAAKWLWLVLGIAAISGLPAHAQGNGPKKRYAVTSDRAYDVTKDVLGRHGYDVVRIEIKGGDRIVYYRAGDRGRGRGKGPIRTLVIRRVENRIVFVDVPDVVLVDIDVRLRL